MNGINWKVRFKQKPFIIALVAALFVVANHVAALFGFELPLGVEDNVMNVVEAALYVLVLLGIIVDPTTDGVGDSAEAKGYEEPKKNPQ